MEMKHINDISKEEFINFLKSLQETITKNLSELTSLRIELFTNKNLNDVDKYYKIMSYSIQIATLIQILKQLLFFYDTKDEKTMITIMLSACDLQFKITKEFLEENTPMHMKVRQEKEKNLE